MDKSERILLFILALAQFTDILDFMIIMPLGDQFSRIFSISPGQFSWIVSSYAVSAFVSGLISAFFIDKLDRKKALLFIFIGFTLGTFACSLANSYTFFVAARCLTGAFGGVLAAMVFAIIGDVIPYERRSSATGIVMTAFSVASVVGVPLGIFIAAQFGWRATFLSIGIMAAVVCVLIFFLVPSMKGHFNKGEKKPPLKVYTDILESKNQMRALAFTVILMLGHFSIIPFIAPYMQRNIGFSDMEVTYIYAIGGLLSAFLLPAFGKIADKYGNIRVFSLASIFALFSIYFITNLPPVSMFIALCATSSFFVVASGRSVPATTLVTSSVKPENRGSFMSVRTSVNQLSLAMGSLIAGFIIVENPDKTYGNYSLVGFFAIFMSVVAIFVARKLKKVS